MVISRILLSTRKIDGNVPTLVPAEKKDRIDFYDMRLARFDQNTRCTDTEFLTRLYRIPYVAI